MKTRNPDDAAPPVVLPAGRLERLVQSVAKAYRKAHVTAEEFRYCQKRVRRLLGLPRASHGQRTRLPEILTPEELVRVLERAYGERPRYGLIVRTLFGCVADRKAPARMHHEGPKGPPKHGIGEPPLSRRCAAVRPPLDPW